MTTAPFVSTAVRARLAVAAVIVLLAVGACRTARIENVRNAPLPTGPGTSLSIDDVARAIRTAGSKLGWVMQEVRPGQMTGTLSVRRHVAVVLITYDATAFSIEYKDSQGLRHEGDEIHRKYNYWVEHLARNIRMEASQLGRR